MIVISCVVFAPSTTIPRPIHRPSPDGTTGFHSLHALNEASTAQGPLLASCAHLSDFCRALTSRSSGGGGAGSAADCVAVAVAAAGAEADALAAPPPGGVGLHPTTTSIAPIRCFARPSASPRRSL